MSAPQTAEQPQRRAIAFGTVTAVSVLTILDMTKVNVGLPSIELALGASSSQLQLIVAGYVLAMGLVMIPAGRLGDTTSRRTLLLTGLGLFTIASVLGALAPSIGLLVLFRILQGGAAGLLTPQVIGFIQELYAGPERGKAFGIFGATVGIATALGPTIGGFLVGVGGEHSGWTLLFWMNLPLGIGLFLLALRYLPARNRVPAERGGLDLPGVLLLAVTVFTLMLPFVLTTGRPEDPPLRWALLIVAVLAGWAFVAWERHYQRRGKQPLIDFALFRLASFRNGALVGASYFAAMPAHFLIMTLYLQQGLGLLPVYAGMVSIGFALFSAVSSWWSGQRVNAIGRPIVIFGLLLVGVGFLSALAAARFAPTELVPWLMAASLAVAGLGGGAVIAPNQTLTLAEVPLRSGGVAGSIAQVGQRVG
ncbi:MFS transporter, partial [Leucobacter sp. M11]|uniref:MFS transporter n=1 Tax=Leucobacter sp. M11 TaxID=2993565 RepID=UPI002D7F9361